MVVMATTEEGASAEDDMPRPYTDSAPKTSHDLERRAAVADDRDSGAREEVGTCRFAKRRCLPDQAVHVIARHHLSWVPAGVCLSCKRLLMRAGDCHPSTGTSSISAACAAW